MDPIYLDYNVTTPLDPAVVDAMLAYLREHFGNRIFMFAPICGASLIGRKVQ
jgi:cysteine sulfinate desulfinase/cysteine desulfurase-like protein